MMEESLIIEIGYNEYSATNCFVHLLANSYDNEINRNVRKRLITL